MTLDLCECCERENVEGFVIETRRGLAGVCYDCADAFPAVPLDDEAPEGA
jgi:hypothetical protein